MNIYVELNEEANDAIAKRVADHNAAVDARNASLEDESSHESHIDAVGYLTACNERMVSGWVQADYNAAVKRLGDQVANLSYSERKSLIAHVEAAGGEE